MNYTSIAVEISASFCFHGFWNIFGVEYAGEFYCGNQIEAGSVPTSTSDCSMLCAGNSSKFRVLVVD